MKHLATFLMMGMLFFVPNVHAAQQQPSNVQAPSRDEQVINRLVSMGQYLRGLKSFGVHSETPTDEVLATGQKLQFAGSANYLVQPPDRLRLELKNDSRHRIYTYDGTTLTQYSPELGFYATVESKGTTGQMVMKVRQQYDLEIPLADLFFWGTDKDGIKDIKEAAFVGTERLGNHQSEHFAFRQEGVDWQIWIQPGEQPLPDKMVITSTDDPAQPNFVAVLTWDLDPKFTDEDFHFTPPKDALKIEIVPVNATAINN